MMNKIVKPSSKIVARNIKGKLIIVPIEDGVADFNDVMFSFNETGTRVWECIEENKSVEEICLTLKDEYDVDYQRIVQTVTELINTLIEKGIVTS